MKDVLLEMMFQHNRWQSLIEHADEKGINLALLKKMCNPQVRVMLYNAIKNEQYEIMPPHEIEIPKDDGTMRLVYANEDQDRILCTLIADCVMELFSDLIHPSCVSYQKGIGTQEIVQRISNKIVKLNRNNNEKPIGFVSDFTKFFDRVTIDKIDEVFDIWESRLGFEHGTEPVINMLRKYYHSTLYIDINGIVQNKYLSLRQGCALAAPLSCMVLYELDEFMSSKYDLYYRYSDDCLTINSDTSEIIDDINSICVKYGTVLNPKKIKPVYANNWFKFLGFLICNDQITLSKNRVKKFTKAIYDATLAKPNITPKQAKENVKRVLYGNGDGYSWATACFSAMQNCDKDVETLNNFVMDALRLCEVYYNYNKERKEKGLKTKKIKISYRKSLELLGGLGVVTNLPDRTLLRGKGSKVRTCRERTQKEIEYYYSVGCLLKAYKISKPIYEACVRGM